MNKLILILLFCFPLFASADNEESVSLNFSSEDFVISKNTNGFIDLYSNKFICTYSSDTLSPGIPQIPVSVLIPRNTHFSEVNSRVEKVLLATNVLLSANKSVAKTGAEDIYGTNQSVNYSGAPDKPCGEDARMLTQNCR